MENRKQRDRFPDLSNPSKPRWREAFTALVAPMFRVHRYRTLRGQSFDQVMCMLECRQPDPDHCE